jgi:hypothetical protein
LARHAEITELNLPEFGLPNVEPVIPSDTYRSRLRALTEQAAEEGYDVLAVYGDYVEVKDVARGEEFYRGFITSRLRAFLKRRRSTS